MYTLCEGCQAAKPVALTVAFDTSEDDHEASLVIEDLRSVFTKGDDLAKPTFKSTDTWSGICNELKGKSLCYRSDANDPTSIKWSACCTAHCIENAGAFNITDGRYRPRNWRALLS